MRMGGSMTTELSRERIIEQLREQGLRITSQRKVILDVILKNNCSCCKEIFYEATKIRSCHRQSDCLPDDEYLGRARSHRPGKAVRDLLRGIIRDREGSDESAHKRRDEGTSQGYMVSRLEKNAQGPW